MRDQFIRLLEVSGLVPSFDSGHTVNAFSGNLELVKVVFAFVDEILQWDDSIKSY